MNNKLLTPHFALLEFTESATARKYGIANTPTPEIVENIRSLCINTLEPLREALGQPVIITSGYRCKALNERITHHATRSLHMTGCAADFYVGVQEFKRFKVQGESHRERLIKAFRTIITSEKVDYDQVIIYNNFIHVSYVSREKNRHRIIMADGQGTYCALTRAQALALV